jgi:hypothetical protein
MRNYLDHPRHLFGSFLCYLWYPLGKFLDISGHLSLTFLDHLSWKLFIYV